MGLKLYLNFAESQTPAHRSRIAYAFRLFCAIYGHQPLLRPDEAVGADARLTYSANGSRSGNGTSLKLGNRYAPRPPCVPAPAPKAFSRDGEQTVLIHGAENGSEPDWLGEIFEWVSCADEYSIKDRDVAGRIPFPLSYLGRHKLGSEMPYAAAAMRFLQNAVCSLVPAERRQPAGPGPSGSHFVVNTHDVDYLPAGYFSSVQRLGKNAVISLLFRKKPALAAKQGRMALTRALGGPDPLDQVGTLASFEARRGVTASYLFIAKQCHRRDGNYDLENPAVLRLMAGLRDQGMEVGIHGSYMSLEHPSRLASEFNVLRKHGFEPAGGRQHWLRFTLNTMIPALEQAGASYDCSLGWSWDAGFRAGACFAFPPYNFEQERPARFLELPLIVMDGNLRSMSKATTESYDEASRILSVSRSFGWGGGSVLWHPNSFGGGQLPTQLGDTFWRLVDRRTEWQDTWTSAADFVRRVRPRYVQCGLLPA